MVNNQKTLTQYPFLDNNEWWIGEEKYEEGEYWVLFVRAEGKFWKSAMLKTELNTIIGIGELEGKPNTAKNAIALVMVGHIKIQMMKSLSKGKNNI